MKETYYKGENLNIFVYILFSSCMLFIFPTQWILLASLYIKHHLIQKVSSLTLERLRKIPRTSICLSHL